jgi:putative nucleotidyltransferase with HDIG domain
MLKRIRVDQLTLGMHLKEFCGSWMDHPFWRTGFIIKDPKDIATILASNIKEVWIDSDKGLDVAPGQASVSEVESEAQVEAQMQEVAQGERQLAPVPAEDELRRARKIYQQSKNAVMSMFQEARMGKALNGVSAERMVQEIADSVSRNLGAMISLARLKTADNYTYMHSVAVCAMMIALARQLGLDEAQTRSAGVAGLLHDVGKMAMPMNVLNKPGKLTDAEFNVIRSHPELGHKMLLAGENIDPIALDVCLHHHEKVDGTGYPKQLRGEQISLFAKMGAVCDVYDAITSNRPYKAGWDPAESMRKMAEWANGHFDAQVFQAFVKSLGIYPIGSLVRLTSGRIGVVVDQTGKSLTTPCVKVFFSTKANLRIAPEVIDLAAPGTREKIVAREDPEKWRFADLNELWSGVSGPL